MSENKFKRGIIWESTTYWSDMRPYPRLRKVLAWIFWKLHGRRIINERIIASVIAAALDWDYAPSNFDNVVDDVLFNDKKNNGTGPA